MIKFFLFTSFILLNLNSFCGINPKNIDIVRDQWGVPHIFGKTDPEVAYGLAWAMCEDDFENTQKLLLAVQGRLGEVDGKDGAILDFMYHISGVEELVEKNYSVELSSSYRKYVEAFAAGINSYAAHFPEEHLRKNIFPIEGKTILKGNAITSVLLTNVYIDFIKIFRKLVGNSEEGINYKVPLPEGSNAFAFNPNKTKDGNTYLAINSHQPLDGLFSWYEAHLVSEEGLNILGGTFPCGPNILHGVNSHLGWAATLNHPDLSDVYELEMHEDEKLKYKFDDEWLMLEERPKRVKVKLGFFRLPIKKKFYWSKYGTTIKNKDGFFSVRFPANMSIASSERMYNLNKVKSLEEFKAVINKGDLPGTNLICADKEHNIFYVSNGQFPYRNKNYNWKGALPGNTSKTLWEHKFYPTSEIVQYENPQCGYLFNTNGSPFIATCDEENIKEENINPTFGYLGSKMINNRTIVAKKLIESYDKIDWEDFKTIKYDQSFDKEMYSYSINNLIELTKLDANKYPKVADAIRVIEDWDMVCDLNDTESAILIFAVNELIDQLMKDGAQYEENSFEEEDYYLALKKARKHMLRHFKSLRVPLHEVQKHVRGDVELGISGAPDVIASNLSQPHKKGTLKAFVGDSYIMLVKFTNDGPIIETVNAYGASNKADSPHYTDQMQLFVDQKTKAMTLDKKEVYKHAKTIYHPK